LPDKQPLQIANDLLFINDDIDYKLRKIPKLVSWISEEQRNLYLAEAGFEFVDPAPELPDPEKAAGPGRDCPLCDGRHQCRRVQRGVSHGMMMILRGAPCPCRLAALFYKRWSKMPERFRWVNLDTLQVSPDALTPPEFQQELLRLLRADPTESYLFTGPAGTGKTTFAAALYRKSLQRWADRAWRTNKFTDAVWRITVSEFMEQYHLRSTGRSDMKVDANGESYMEEVIPTVNANGIRAAVEAGHRPCLFLEDLDKFNPSRFKFVTLFAVVNQIFEARGQIVATSNYNPAQIEELFGKEEGSTLMRRISNEKTENSIAFPTTS
jgi:DNA replication protein DnaC